MEAIGVGFGGREISVDKVSCVRICLPLPFSMVESPLFGVGDCVNVPPCSSGT